MMPSLNNYHILISHSWDYNNDYTTIKGWLDSAPYTLTSFSSDSIKNGRWNRSTLHAHIHSLPPVEILLGGQRCVFHAVVAFLSPDVKHKTDREKVKIRNGNPDLHTP